MNTGPALAFPSSTEALVEAGGVRAGRLEFLPSSGSAATGETKRTPNLPPQGANAQDEVKVQFEPPGETPVYQFVNQHGSLVLQVPSQQMLSLARQISKELAQEAAPKPAAEGGK